MFTLYSMLCYCVMPLYRPTRAVYLIRNLKLSQKKRPEFEFLKINIWLGFCTFAMYT